MKIYSASRREDMPAFRMHKIIDKMYCCKDDFFVLWTKDPRKIVSAKLDLSRVALQLTVTGFGGSDLEPGVPEPALVWDAVRQLIGQGLNPALINWRLDPILPSRHTAGQVKSLADVAASIGITRCMISFVTFYDQVKDRWPEWEQYTADKIKQIEIVQSLHGIMKPRGITLYGCAQPHLSTWLSPAHCIDGVYYSRITGFDFATDKDAFQRKSCGCTHSVDIGSYKPCAHACVYCYSKTAPLDESGDGAKQPDLF